MNQVSQITPAVRHATDKVRGRLNAHQPMPGSPRAVIHLTLDEGEFDHKGGKQLIAADGTISERRLDAALIRPPRSLYDEFARQIAKVKDNELLDRVDIVASHDRQTTFIRQGRTWLRSRP